jgi:hypothetical protein
MTAVTIQVRAVPEVVNRRPFVRDAQFSNSDVACGISGGKVALRQGFLRIIRFCP